MRKRVEVSRYREFQHHQPELWSYKSPPKCYWFGIQLHSLGPYDDEHLLDYIWRVESCLRFCHLREENIVGGQTSLWDTKYGSEGHKEPVLMLPCYLASLMDNNWEELLSGGKPELPSYKRLLTTVQVRLWSVIRDEIRNHYWPLNSVEDDHGTSTSTNAISSQSSTRPQHTH